MSTGRHRQGPAHSAGAPRHEGHRAERRRPPLAPRLRIWPFVVGALVLTMSAGVVRAAMSADSTGGAGPGVTTGAPEDVAKGAPPPGGYFDPQPAGSWQELPGDRTCAQRVRRTPWEPRPGNHRANHTEPDVAAVHESLSSRPRGADGSYDERWNTWLLPRITGAHSGSTDENIQWAACKWGLSDNLLRAIAALESRWFQGSVDPATGRCVETRGCNDIFTAQSSASDEFCAEISRHGHDYTSHYRPGRCPRTFSLVGVMAWQDPEWGAMAGNQNGTFPFSRDSTAFALDYLGGFLRGCQEGWLSWLGRTGEGDYGPGDVWGCVGTWYAGAWKIDAAQEYTSRVRQLLSRKVWLDPAWAE